MTSFWTADDERRLVELRCEYEAMIARKCRSDLFTPDTYRGPVSALALYQERRLRNDRFAEIQEIFGEPAWDMLLDLQIARQRSLTVSATSACLASRRPQSTALRFLTLLERAGMVESSEHPTDRRTRNVSLTKHAASIMDSYLKRLGGMTS